MRKNNRNQKSIEEIQAAAVARKSVTVVKQGFRNFVAVDENGHDVENTRSHCEHLARIIFLENQKKASV